MARSRKQDEANSPEPAPISAAFLATSSGCMTRCWSGELFILVTLKDANEARYAMI